MVKFLIRADLLFPNFIIFLIIFILLILINVLPI
ncbi:MAG: hypothetical protein XD89_0124 [Anaerolineae bacterium 49_20]|nr:MAG: hypothetical protein XD89_0124 [Anaerolineae bacterium 49_20]